MRPHGGDADVELAGDFLVKQPSSETEKYPRF
jgi:hypothetical protein